MMLTLAPTSGSVHSTSAVSFGAQPFAFACWANQAPCVVPESAHTAPNEGTFATLRYICTLGMHPFVCRMSRNAFERESSCWAWITPASFLRTAFRAWFRGSVVDGYFRLYTSSWNPASAAIFFMLAEFATPNGSVSP